jgi:integrase
MSAKFSTTTADYIPWDEAINLVRRLYKDGNYVMSAFVGVGIFTGLRVTDLRNLRWCDLLGEEVVTIIEHKTKKKRQIKLNKELQDLLKGCYKELKVTQDTQHIFLSQKKTTYSIQRLNVLLKELRSKYHLHCKHISNHSLRKTFGRRIFEMASNGGGQEMALIKLSKIFGHANTQITRRYLGLKHEEMMEAYDLLSF